LSLQAFITNENAPWEIPPGRISSFYLEGAYLPPEGWRIVGRRDIEFWMTGVCGELRKKMEVKINV
jgi:hypothetical protein